MANVTSLQILEDGPRYTVVKFEGILDSADLSSTTVLDPAAQSPMDTAFGTLASKYRIDHIIHNIEDGLAVNLYWDASTPIRIEELTGRGKQNHSFYGGLKNNAGTYASTGIFTPAAGFTGKITAITQGWSAGAVLSFSLILTCVKQ